MKYKTKLVESDSIADYQNIINDLLVDGYKVVGTSTYAIKESESCYCIFYCATMIKSFVEKNSSLESECNKLKL